MNSDPHSQDPRADPALAGLNWCLALLDGLIGGGLRQLVLSPGSRSTPMVLAAEARPVLTLTPILDERSAAFFALGLAQTGGRPVALLATSGSAPAHWHPAVMEASAASVPLVLISADRPPDLRGWGANQTTDQTRLFGPLVRTFHDPGAPWEGPGALAAMTALGRRLMAECQGVNPGPVHINLPLREPLVPAMENWQRTARWLEAAADSAATTGRTSAPLELPPGLSPRLKGRGLIYCGPDRERPGFAEALWACAAALGVPVLTDPLSPLRCAPVPERTRVLAPRIARYKALVRNPGAARALAPDWVLRFGRAPVSRTVMDWLAGVPTLLVDPQCRWSDPGHSLALEASLHLPLDPVALCEALAHHAPQIQDPRWSRLWAQAEQGVADLTSDYLAQAPWCEGHLIRDLLASLPAGDGLLCANSLPIRQFETWAGARDAPLRIFGNRGLSGIDGQLSTLAGLNAGGRPTTGLLGDLSFLHDLSGLLLARGLDRPCIVLNNGGGRIFDYLPQAGLPDLERLWRTPRPVHLDRLAATFDLGYRSVADPAHWRQILAADPASLSGTLIEVVVDARQSLEVHLELRRVLTQANLMG